jgi:flagellar export protein FliJ
VKTFRFRAARVLDLRRRERDAAQAHLARAREASRSAEDALTRAERDHQDALARYREDLIGSIDLDRVERHKNWIVRLQGVVAACQRSHQERLLAAASAADAVRLAHRRVRVLERLRDRTLRRHAEDVRRQETKDIDQLATLGFARRAAEGGREW